MKQMLGSPASPLSSTDTISFSYTQQDQHVSLPMLFQQVIPKKESEPEIVEIETDDKVSLSVSAPISHEKIVKDNKKTCGTSLQLPLGKDNVPELQLPIAADWTQDTFWAQLNSPWLQNWTAYSNILNF
ncbi:hypothetical protein TSUD_91690 [Trifolium subterraneum]|uniref:Uncharacterized protein n=1 Tax=Trifolium subterraneum TaxID=3900 RepID=A0A2Z6P4D9_TRISU|nr:hypothetical protein TSUD_91690 [Trifolium subterraneum]